MTGPEDTRWVARVAPTAQATVDALLALPVGLDVWERDDDSLVVAATEAQLSELERRRLARVERMSTVAAYVEEARRRADETTGGREGGGSS